MVEFQNRICQYCDSFGGGGDTLYLKEPQNGQPSCVMEAKPVYIFFMIVLSNFFCFLI